MENVPPLPDKAKALIKMLASDNDGEALGAARALGRTLKSNGLDFHDIVRALDHPGYARQRPCAVCAQHARTAQRTEKGAHADDLAWLLQQDFPFSPREREFLDSLQSWRGELTEKQANWFGNIVTKVKARAEAHR